MDCKFVESYLQAGLKSFANDEPSAAIKEHLRKCVTCRNEYARILGDETLAGEIGPDPAGDKKINSLKDDPADSFPDLSNPVEYKDAPITFTLVVDDREKEIKVVEPQLDYPLPEGARLKVHEKEDCLVDVTYTFMPQNGRPYQLDFAKKARGTEIEPHIRTYGDPARPDKGLSSVFSEGLIDRGGVKAWIEMTNGAARIFIHYTA
jgi:hypothetical protein